jgi:hypothetical protein
MDELAWLEDQLDQLRQSSSSYNDQAFYFALKQLALEQQKRLDQLQRELDGRMWQN